MTRNLLLLVALLFASPATADDSRTLAFGGDVMFGRMTKSGYVSHPATELDRWSDALRNADIAFVNLETGICDTGRAAGKLPVLWAPSTRLDELRNAGIDVVSVANNHALDCGPEGLASTTKALSSRRIAHVGVREQGAVHLADDVVVIAATMHPPPYRSEGGRPAVHRRGDGQLLRDVQQLREKHPDHAIIVSLHWGKERSKRVAAWQETLAEKLVDAGATIVAGHGPHTPQHTKQLGDSLVMFSLGNLVFDDSSPIGRPVAPLLVRLTRTRSGWRAEL